MESGLRCKRRCKISEAVKGDAIHPSEATRSATNTKATITKVDPHQLLVAIDMERMACTVTPGI